MINQQHRRMRKRTMDLLWYTFTASVRMEPPSAVLCSSRPSLRVIDHHITYTLQQCSLNLGTRGMKINVVSLFVIRAVIYGLAMHLWIQKQ